MNSGLPINLGDLLHLRAIEGNRVEFKATWDKKIAPSVVRSVCAFANDLLNLNGGYIILGVEEAEGKPLLPPRGLGNMDIDRVQKEIRGACARIQPDYQPVLFPEYYGDSLILVIWAPGGDNRPYEAPDDYTAKGSQRYYYIRQGSETVQARGEFLRQLMESAAKIPFDDRRNQGSSIEDISPSLVRKFLRDIRSELSRQPDWSPDVELYRTLRIVSPINSHLAPRNVGLLFFNEQPDSIFPGARIEVVEFGDDAGGDLIEERVFRGPVAQQITATLEYLDSMGGTLLRKISGQAEVERTVPYPYEAMEEALVNAVYHRGYDGPPEPIKVYLYPDRMEIVSYPGPVAGISKEDFEPGRSIPLAPARNRRIGEFLKELRLAEGRGTGIPKIRRQMHENGSPEARFDFDAEHTYFRVTLPVHPRYQVLNALREAAHLWATGYRSQSVDLLARAFQRQPGSGAIASQILEYSFAMGDLDRANAILNAFDAAEARTEVALPYLTMARLLLDRNLTREASEVLRRTPVPKSVGETVEAAILRKRSGDLEGAHRLFAEAYAINPDDPKIVHEFAQTKIRVAQSLNNRDIATKKRLNREAAELLRRAIQLSSDTTREAWCWFDLARTLDWLRSPSSEVEAAYLKAQSLLPGESRFTDHYQRWRRVRGANTSRDDQSERQ